MHPYPSMQQPCTGMHAYIDTRAHTPVQAELAEERIKVVAALTWHEREELDDALLARDKMGGLHRWRAEGR